MKLGSLFDGSGGFPLAGAIHGITPMWAAEIEAYPIKVTKARFPQMKHLGSVLDVNGAEVEPVDIITFGSPCQDLSVAGKQAGLHKGERSNLFFEAIRIIKEMRNATNNIYPRIAVWENVPGAFSSNKGEDFRAVLEAFVQINDEAADVPRPASGKWNPAGAIVGNGWSIAWRTFDAQYWGVPQRRRRIYLIADFGSERAGEILFEQEGGYRDSAPGGTAGEGTSDNAEGSAGRSGVRCLNPFMPQSSRIYSAEGVYPCLSSNESGGLNRQAIVFKERAGCPGGGKGILCGDKPFTLSTMTDQAVCYPIDSHQQDSRFKVCADGISPTLPGQMGTGGNNGPMVLESYTAGNGQLNQSLIREQARTLDCMHDQQIVIKPSKPPRKYIIRRLTPLECCRLQGFPGIVKLEVGLMTRDEIMVMALALGFVKVDFDTGKIYRNRGPGGIPITDTECAGFLHPSGYKYTTININGIKKQCRVNRLVWTAAHGKIPDGYVIAHINNDKTDNRLSNLELLTPEQNSHNAKRDGLYLTGDDCPQSKVTVEQSKEIAEIWAFGGKSTIELAKMYGISKSRVQQIVHEFAAWDGDVEGSDSARYRLWGNGIALPNAEYVIGCAKKLIEGGITCTSYPTNNTTA